MSLAELRAEVDRLTPEERLQLRAHLTLKSEISEEAFLKDNATVSTLKLRVGYGTTGQQDISAQYDYLRRVTLGTINSQYIFGNTP